METRILQVVNFIGSFQPNTFGKQFKGDNFEAIFPENISANNYKRPFKEKNELNINGTSESSMIFRLLYS